MRVFILNNKFLSHQAPWSLLIYISNVRLQNFFSQLNTPLRLDSNIDSKLSNNTFIINLLVTVRYRCLLLIHTNILMTSSILIYFKMMHYHKCPLELFEISDKKKYFQQSVPLNWYSPKLFTSPTQDKSTCLVPVIHCTKYKLI